MKFAKGKGSDFYTGLNIRINQYFRQTGRDRFGSRALYGKGAVLLLAYAGCYACLFLFAGRYAVLVPACIGLGLSGVMIVFNLVHDAAHGAVSSSKRINTALTTLGDLVGINTYIWNIRHNIQHHTFTNVLGGDLIIENIPLIRLSEHQPRFAYHRYQCYYAPVLYLLYSFYWIFVIDFRLFFMKDICNLKGLKHPVKEWVRLFFFKGLYITYMIVLPAVFTEMSLGAVLLLFLLTHAAAGLLLSFIAVLGHFVEGPSFPEPEGGVLHNSWSEHELEATIDFAPDSRLLHWLTGGLNTHVAHHLYPNVCHVHYLQMTPVIEQYCREHGYTYRRESLPAALASHFRYLRRLAG